MDQDVELKLKKAKTVKDMLQVLTDEYRLEDCEPGIVKKPALIYGLKEAIKLIKPVRRQKQTSS